MDRILVVDDSPVVCAVLRNWLEAAGYEVATASDASAVEVALASSPSLLLLDLLLPDLDGLELCRRLKEDEETARLPVVILTSAGSSENRIRCLELGAEDFLTKPVDHEELLARARSLLRARRLSDRLLISTLELDKLGAFAERFAGQPIADWGAVEVATSIAHHVLGPVQDSANHPRMVWAGLKVRRRMLGVAWSQREDAWRQENTAFDESVLEQALRPFERQDGEVISRTPMPSSLCELLHLPATPPPRNFVALRLSTKAVLAADYPWEVGVYEMPLLRAVLRHWAVFERIRFEARQTEKAFFATMEALALAAEFYDGETARHVRRVGAYARLVAEALGADRSFVKWISKSAPMHDVGKITVPIELVRKPGRLTDEERRAMQTHALNGSRLLANYPQLEMARNIAAFHHENVDGSGYPEGRRDEEVPLEARIVRIVDVYDALRTARPYKPAYPHATSLAVLRHGDEAIHTGCFDARVLEAFLDRHRDMERIHEELTVTIDSSLARPPDEDDETMAPEGDKGGTT